MADVTDYRMAKGWLTMPEREALVSWAREMANHVGVTLNIGIEFGASMHCLRHGTGLLIGVDLIGDDKMEGGPIPESIIIKGPSQYAYQLWQPLGASIKLLFVDGGHDYQTVMDDARFAAYVVVGGIVAFHDTAMSPAEDDVNRAVSDWLAARPGQFHELPQVDSIRAFRRV